MNTTTTITKTEKPIKTTKQQKPKTVKQDAKSQKPTKVVGRQKPDQLIYRVPHCAALYAAALVDPFRAPGGACVPADLFPLPSSKVKTFLRGRFSLGTTGYGYITARPGAATTSMVVTATTAASVGGTATLFSAYTNLSTVVMAQCPYTSAQITAGVGARVVACGVRIKYIGQLMNRNGIVLAYEDPDHKDFAPAFSFDTLGGNPYCKASRVGDELWDSEVCFSGPTTPTDIEFQQSDYPLGINLFMGMAVSGVAGDAYEYEFFQHLEYIGNIVVNKTPSHADAQAFGKVVETSKALTQDKPLQSSDIGGFWNHLKESFISSMPKIISAGREIYGAVTGPNPISILRAAGAMTSLDQDMRDRSHHLMYGGNSPQKYLT